MSERRPGTASEFECDFCSAAAGTDCFLSCGEFCDTCRAASRPESGPHDEKDAIARR